MLRCFVALWPDNDAAQRLGDLAARLSSADRRARAVPAESLHLTLAFIGQVTDARAAQLAVALSSIATCVDWDLNQIGMFRRARVLWVAGAANPDLGALAKSVRALLKQMQISFDARPFVPHLTLLRDFDPKAFPGTPALGAPITSHFRPPRLARSDSSANGPQYRLATT